MAWWFQSANQYDGLLLIIYGKARASSCGNILITDCCSTVLPGAWISTASDQCTRKGIGKKAQEWVREGEILIISLQDKWQVQAPGDQGRLAGDGYAWWCTFWARSWGLFYKALIPFMRVPPISTIQRPISTYEFWGGHKHSFHSSLFFTRKQDIGHLQL